MGRKAISKWALPCQDCSIGAPFHPQSCRFLKGCVCHELHPLPECREAFQSRGADLGGTKLPHPRHVPLGLTQKISTPSRRLSHLSFGTDLSTQGLPSCGAGSHPCWCAQSCLRHCNKEERPCRVVWPKRRANAGRREFRFRFTETRN